ncbi:hypothetical protein ACIRO1_34320 [Streptomyces sp. NPDC102381]|uniref:hypothetical protein n=1 Tax=Streptomyces sp. NPDC102381 TaxID=3366164 RepID=UPI0038181E7A
MPDPHALTTRGRVGVLLPLDLPTREVLPYAWRAEELGALRRWVFRPSLVIPMSAATCARPIPITWTRWNVLVSPGVIELASMNCRASRVLVRVPVDRKILLDLHVDVLEEDRYERYQMDRHGAGRLRADLLAHPRSPRSSCRV